MASGTLQPKTNLRLIADADILTAADQNDQIQAIETNAASISLLQDGLTTDGLLTSGNVLLVAASSPTNVANGRKKFYQPGTAIGSITNLPPTLANLGCLVWRDVQYLNSDNLLVILTEHLPVPGRMWFNKYASGTWTGWKSVTPV